MDHYKALAEANTANAAINSAAGAAGVEPGLRAKTHSRCSAEEFEAILDYLKDLEVRHGPAARGLPGIVAWGDGTIEIEEKAVAITDGLVLAERDVEVHAGVLDVIGAVAARNFFSKDGTVVSWQEVP